MGYVQYSEPRCSVMNRAAQRHNLSLNNGVQKKYVILIKVLMVNKIVSLRLT
jgi:hypothetical protein